MLRSTTRLQSAARVASPGSKTDRPAPLVLSAANARDREGGRVGTCALPIYAAKVMNAARDHTLAIGGAGDVTRLKDGSPAAARDLGRNRSRSGEHTSEL